MKKKPLIILASLIIVLFGGLILFNVIRNIMIKRFFKNYEPPAVTVSSVKAVKTNWQSHIAAVGNFVAVQGVEVNSQAAGNVVKIHFESGQYLEKGQPLIDIDDQIAQAILKFNKADLALRQLNYQRQADLLKRQATASSSVDEATAKLLQAKANVEKIEAQINEKHIRAPFSGRLGIREVNLGQYITPGQTSIVTLQSMDPLFLEFHLPEQLLKKIHINQRIEFQVDAFSSYLFEGKITAINAKVDPNTHNIWVQATVPNCPANLSNSTRLRLNDRSTNEKKLIQCNTDLNKQNHLTEFAFIPGMFAAISVEQPATPNVIVLPATAISYSLYGNAVFVIKEKMPAQNRKEASLYVERVFVKTGEQEGNMTLIESGVNEGQEVVSSGELKLQNGTRVQVNNSIHLKTTVQPDKLNQ